MANKNYQEGEADREKLDDRLPNLSAFMNSMLNETIFLVEKSRKLKRRLKQGDLDLKENRIADLFSVTQQVYASYITLDHSLSYLRLSSRRPPSVKVEEHIRYHSEYMLHQIYVLREMLTNVFPVACKIGGKWVESKDYRAEHKRIRGIISRHFLHLTDQRKVIVHKPFELTDVETDLAEMTASLRVFHPDRYEPLYRDQLAELKRTKILSATKWQKSSEMAIEAVFQYLNNEFVRDGAVQLPEQGD